MEELCRECAPSPSLVGTSCVVIETEAQFRRLEALWRGLYAAGTNQSPFATWEWAWGWWRTFGRAPRADADAAGLLIIAVLDADGQMIGLVPFHYSLGPRRRGTMRVLRAFGFLGKHYEAMTEEPTLLLTPGAERQALESALWFLLRRQRRVPWDCVELWVQHAEDRLMAAPPDAWPAPLTRLQHLKVLPVMEMVLPASWDALRASVSRSMRDNIKYYPRLLERHGHSWAVKIVTAPAEVAQESDALVWLHRQREEKRQSLATGGHLPSSVHRHFLREHLCAMAREGRASVAVLWIDGERAASQALLHSAPSTLFYYSGFSPAWAAYSPMTILQAEILTHLIAQKVTRVNFLAYDQPWKTRWGAKPSQRLQQLAYARPHPASWTRTYLYSRTKKRYGDCLEIIAGPSGTE